MEFERIHEYTNTEDTASDEDEAHQEVTDNRILSPDLRILREIFDYKDENIKVSGVVYFDHHEPSEKTMNKHFQ